MIGFVRPQAGPKLLSKLPMTREQPDFPFRKPRAAVAARGSLNLEPLAESLLTRNVKIHTFQQILSGATNPIRANRRSGRGGLGLKSNKEL